MTWLIVAAVAWGALAFGAVYPWAWWPLVALAAATGLVGLRPGAPTDRPQLPRGLFWALGAVGLGIAVQLVPLPGSVLRALSPETEAFLRKHRALRRGALGRWLGAPRALPVSAPHGDKPHLPCRLVAPPRRPDGITGIGLNAFGEAMLDYQTTYLTKHFGEAHNDWLQLVAEGGFLVGIPILVTLILFIRQIRRRFREAQDDAITYWLRAGAVTGLVAIALQEFVEFSLQIPGNAVLFTVLAAIAIHRPPAEQTRRNVSS